MNLSHKANTVYASYFLQINEHSEPTVNSFRISKIIDCHLEHDTRTLTSTLCSGRASR